MSNDERAAFEAAMGSALIAEQGEFALSRAYEEGRPYTFLATKWAWAAWQAAYQRAQPSDIEITKLISCVRYLTGIAERGLKRQIREDESVESFVLGYVQSLETQPSDDVAKDAARYQWLVKHSTYGIDYRQRPELTLSIYAPDHRDGLSAAIDAAMGQGGSDGQ